jgi:hypothetical protein
MNNFNHLSSPESFYDASDFSDASGESNSNFSRGKEVAGRATTPTSSAERIQLRSISEYLCRHRWILKSLDMGIKREFTLWWNKNYVAQESQPNITNGLDAIEDPYENLDGDQLSSMITSAPVVIPRISGQIARICRLELYISDRPTEAEIIVIREWLVRHMNSRQIRKNVQSSILPYALKFSLIPTRDELRARELTLQPEYQQRLDSQQPLYSRGRKWLFNWLGRKIREPVARTV